MHRVERRDYTVGGPEATRAREHGLVEADWWMPEISPESLASHMRRSNWPGVRDTALWVALLVLAGLAAYATLGTWLAIPAFVVYGALYGGSADSRWHEFGHNTVFRTPWHNTLFYHAASFMTMRRPTMARWNHIRHHSDTAVVGRDPGAVAHMRPPRYLWLAADHFRLMSGAGEIREMLRNTFGRVSASELDFLPADQVRRVVWESRVFVAILSGVVAWSFVAGSVVPLLFIGLPSFYGGWLLTFLMNSQHGGLAEDVLDHRLNSRTVYMNPVLRFLYMNMNYHVEHHLHPSIPYHALPAFHADIKDQLPEPSPSNWHAYREIWRALRAQGSDPEHQISERVIPVGAATSVAPAAIVVSAGVDGWATVCALDHLEVDTVQEVTTDSGQKVALYRLDDGFYATGGICTHGRTSLAGGLVINGEIECPKHNGRFEIRTGEPVRKPVCVALDVFRCRVADGEVQVDLEVSLDQVIKRAPRPLDGNEALAVASASAPGICQGVVSE